MKIAIIGTKGIPANYGGFETFAFHLTKHLASASFEVTVVNEFDNPETRFDFPVTILHSDFKKSKNPLLFYKQSLSLVIGTHDIVLVCGVGGSIFYPFKKGKAIIVTNIDGLEHLRGKYTYFQRKFVFLLQKITTVFSDHLIADSNAVMLHWLDRFPKSKHKLSTIAYGADIPYNFDESILLTWRLEPESFFLVVARLVPENNLIMILNAFAMYKGNKKLVIVGNTSDNSFARSISQSSDNRILFIGGLFVKEKLDCLRKNCIAYIHGHSVGGTNPALLEAMICKCVCICHSNIFNDEVTGNTQLYFDSATTLLNILNTVESDAELRAVISEKAFTKAGNEYTWPLITEKYRKLFTTLFLKRKL